MAVPNTVVYFTSYDQLKLAFGYKNGQKNSKLIPFMCGGIARCKYTKLTVHFRMVLKDFPKTKA